MSGYFKNIKEAVSTLTSGLKLTLKYFSEARYSHAPIGVEDPSYFEQDKGIVTLQYPKESIPVPDNGRYKLHNEIDDCIVCDKCAKVCPVDCIEIDPIRAVETYGHTSDGTPKKIHAAKFDIDMSKCCYCGLCTTVCPTECLTMTKEYDYSEFDVEDHIFSFGNMSLVEIAEKKKELAEMEAKKAAEKEAQGGSVAKKPAMKPMRPKPAGAVAKPAVRPKPIAKKEDAGETAEPKKVKPVMKAKPVIKPKISSGKSEDQPKAEAKPKPIIKPRPVIKKVENKDVKEEKPKVVKPKMKPVIKPKIQAKPEEEAPKAEKPKYRPRPMIPKKKKDDGHE